MLSDIAAVIAYGEVLITELVMENDLSVFIIGIVWDPNVADTPVDMLCVVVCVPVTDEGHGSPLCCPSTHGMMQRGSPKGAELPKQELMSTPMSRLRFREVELRHRTHPRNKYNNVPLRKIHMDRQAQRLHDDNLLL